MIAIGDDLSEAMQRQRPAAPATGEPAVESQPPTLFFASQAMLQEWFASVDQRRSGRLNASLVQQALAMGGVNFSLQLVASLVRLHCTDNALTLDFGDFVRMQQFVTSLAHTFSQCGRGRAHLSVPQVQEALQGFGLDMQPDGAFYKLVQSYDYGRSALVDLEAFIAMSVQLRNAQRVFRLFDAQQRAGRVTMDFNQFVWSVAQL